MNLLYCELHGLFYVDCCSIQEPHICILLIYQQSNFCTAKYYGFGTLDCQSVYYAQIFSL